MTNLANGLRGKRFAQFTDLMAGILALYGLVYSSRVLGLMGIFLPAAQHRAICLLFAIFLTYALYSSSGASREAHLPWYDILLIVCGLVGAGYVGLSYDTVLNYSFRGFLDTFGVILSLLLGLSLLEASRRIVGWSVSALIIFFVLITVFQDHLPGLLHGKGFALDRLCFSVYVGSSGIFGSPLGVAVTIILTYIIFGRLLQQAGGGQWFIDIAISLTGWMRGGPAKAAVVASGLFGMISGSPSANVATTGVITIPLMIKTGYSAKFAGAVEAVASTGGQFMPPVMGAIAFIMAEWLNIPYVQIAIAAFLPGILYFLVLYFSIHIEGGRLNLKAIPRSELPSFFRSFRKGWYYSIPLITLIYYLIIRGYPPEMACIYAILVLIGVSYLSPDKNKHLRPRKIWDALVGGTKTWLVSACVTAVIGILIGSLELSGLGIRFSSFLLSISQGDLFLTLLFVGIGSFILGTGLDTIPCYITLTILTAPALMKLGVAPMTAHLYVIYWGLAAHITPPTCTPVFIACGMSGGKIWETGWEAVRLGMAIFVVPFAFVYNPALLAKGTFVEIALAFATAIIGSVFVAVGIRGGDFTGREIPWWIRLLTFCGGILLIGPTTLWTAISGLGLGSLGFVYNTLKKSTK